MATARPTTAAPLTAGKLRLRTMLQRRQRTLLGTTSVVLFLILWELVGSQNIVRSEFISSPTEVVTVGASMVLSGELQKHLLVSLQELVLGLVPAIVLGMALGLAMGRFRRLGYLLDPLVMALYSAPRIALIPVIVIWFGVGMESKEVVVFLGAIFPVLVNTMAAVKQIEEIWVRAVRAFGGNEFQVVTKVILPGSLPGVMAGIRLGFGRGIIALIVGEMYVSVVGLGRLIQVYSGAGRAGPIFVVVIVIAVFGFVCITALRWFEEWVGPWRRDMEL